MQSYCRIESDSDLTAIYTIFTRCMNPQDCLPDRQQSCPRAAGEKVSAAGKKISACWQDCMPDKQQSCPRVAGWLAGGSITHYRHNRARAPATPNTGTCVVILYYIFLHIYFRCTAQPFTSSHCRDIPRSYIPSLQLALTGLLQQRFHGK